MLVSTLRSSQTVSNVNKSEIIKHILVCFTYFFVGHIIPYVFFHHFDVFSVHLQ